MTTLRRRLTGLAALLAILALLIGLPAVLLAVGANPFPAGIPSLADVVRALAAPDDGTLLLALIKIVAWLSWAFLALTMVVEILAQLRGIKAPRLPGLQLPQGAARRLVSAAALLFITLPVVANAAHAAPVNPGPVASAPAQTGVPQPPSAAAGTPGTPPSAEAPATESPAPTRKHTVVRGDTLWSIAEKRLGDGKRYKEIVALNPGVFHGKASAINVGWTLNLPAAPQDATTKLKATPGEVTYQTVTVRAGDTLSELALKHLGDGARYPEIVAASKGIKQPGGARLTDPDVIDVGWKLRIPIKVEAPAAPDPAPAPEGVPALPPAAVAPAPAPSAAPVTPAASAGVETPAAATAPQAAAATTAPAPADTADPEPAAATVYDQLTEDTAWRAQTAAGVGTLLAAGVIALIARRRRTQQQHRRPGTKLPMPAANVAATEHELRAAADPLSVELVDLSLRALSRTCSQTAQPLPDVRAARLTADQFDLYLTEPAELPPPWANQHAHTVWTLAVEAAKELAGEDHTDTPAPYPALVTIGHDEEQGHVLLNLERLGALGILGDQTQAREVMAALAVELATSAWADDLQVTVVGDFVELEDSLKTGRIRYLPSAARLIEDLAARATADRAAMAEDGAVDLNDARARGLTPDAWAPEIVLLSGQVTPRQRTMLSSLLDEMPRVAIAAITYGAVAGEWTIRLPEATDEPATIEPIGLQITPQRLPVAQYDHLLEVAALADVDELDDQGPVEVVTVAQVDEVTPVNEPAPPASSMPAISTPPVPVTVHQHPEYAGFLLPASVLEALTETTPETIEAPGTPPQPSPTATSAPTEAPTTIEDAPTREDEAMTTTQDHPAPRILVLGPVAMLHALGKVEPSKKARLLEYAAYLALYPGATHRAIDDAIWPDRTTEDNLNTRNPATSKLRRWVGTTADGEEYLPRHQAGGGYGFAPAVTTDAADWDALVRGNPLNAATEDLEAALKLVRGVPFEAAHPKRYAWAEPVRQRLISEIVDASYELTRRRLMEGRWRAAEQAVVVGLRIEPAQENLWRLRILAAHESRNPAAEAEAIDRLLAITEQLECDLEPATEELLQALKRSNTDFDHLIANAL